MVAIERKADGAFPQYWGQGYASEAGRAWLGYGFETLGRERLIAMADTPNYRSIAVMKRLGMTFDHEARLRDGDDEFDATVYAISRAAWRS